MSTKLSPRKRAGIPPLNFYRRPQATLPSRWRAELEWLGHLWKRQARQWLEYVTFLGWSSEVFRARYLAARGMDREQITRREMSFYDGIAGIPSVVLAPAELEFPQHQLQPDEYYLHFPVQRDEAHLWSPDYKRVLNRITAAKSGGRVKIVYASVGTLAHGNYKRAERLLRILIDTLGRMADVEAVVATGGIWLEGLRPEPHVHVLATLPQVHLLSHCDLMITHGGLGSVKECLQAGVPMLVYPLNEEVDQPGNSARVVARGWGHRGSIRSSPARVRQQVQTMLQQLPAYRERCRQARLTLLRAAPEPAVDQLLAQLALPTFDSAECSYP
ncbi:MAG: hypothetical protein ICV83_33700 [Cytophagales bacterium]|nr:hypothetical protein [Cytophagales bacterium]